MSLKSNEPTLMLIAALILILLTGTCLWLGKETGKEAAKHWEAAKHCGLESGIAPEGEELYDMPYYKVDRVSNGKVGVTCLNGGDPTIQPQTTEGYVVVSCGLR